MWDHFYHSPTGLSELQSDLQWKLKLATLVPSDLHMKSTLDSLKEFGSVLLE